MNSIYNNDIEKQIKELKLEKRSYLLNGKDTRELDRKIKMLQMQLNNDDVQYKTV